MFILVKLVRSVNPHYLQKSDCVTFGLTDCTVGNEQTTICHSSRPYMLRRVQIRHQGGKCRVLLV